MESLGGDKCYQLYKELLELSKGYTSLCDDGDFSEEASLSHIKDLLNKRQVLIETIDSIKGDYTDVADKEGLKDLIQQILAIDRKSIEYFSKQRVTLREKINKIQQGKKSNKAYEPYALQNDGYFIDQKK